MRKHWDSWGWLAAAIGLMLAFIFLMYLSHSLFDRETWCYGPKDQCLREWVSALSGWFAFAAAVPTVLVLLKQVRDAERHHRQGAKIQLRHARALAHKTSLALDAIENECRAIALMLAESVTNRFTISDLQAALEGLEYKLQSKEIKKFEDEISIGIYETNEMVLIQFDEAKRAAGNLSGRYTDDALIPVNENAANFLRMSVDWVLLYTTECRNRIDSFLREYAEMTR